MEKEEKQTALCPSCQIKKVSTTDDCPDCGTKLQSYQLLLKTEVARPTIRIDHKY